MPIDVSTGKSDEGSSSAKGLSHRCIKLTTKISDCIAQEPSNENNFNHYA